MTNPQSRVLHADVPSSCPARAAIDAGPFPAAAGMTRMAWSGGVPALMFALVVAPGATACTGASKPAPPAHAEAAHPWVKADVDFMQGMIMHHGQALAMAALVPTHGSRADLKTLAEKITASQRAEIGLMQAWLRDRQQTVTDPGDNMGGMLMPGMLTREQMATLAATRGATFDSLFLTGMIQHHTGALTMVKNLFATPGAGQESEMYAFASDVNAGQSAEITRMQAMLNTHPSTTAK